MDMEVSKELDLLDGWWTSEDVHALESRAVFSNEWISVAHISRFVKPGDYLTFELAGYPILIILGKDRIVRAFHNVCRHRAYTITKKTAGSSLVLGCRYHGWSYDTRGRLVKAPQFDGIEGFDKTKNGLFSVKACIDRAGFVHISLHAGHLDSAPNCADLLQLAGSHGIEKSSKWLGDWEMEGNFNWKMLGTHPSAVTENGKPTSDTFHFLRRLFDSRQSSRIDLRNALIFYHAPVTTIIVFPHAHIWISLVSIPKSALQCSIRCSMFSADAAELHSTQIQSLKDFVEAHIYNLETRYTEIKKCRPSESSMTSDLKAHLRLERLTGMEIHPARRDEGGSESFCKAEKVCKELDAIAKLGIGKLVARTEVVSGSLDW